MIVRSEATAGPVTLRAPRPDDAALYAAIVPSPDIRRLYGVDSGPARPRTAEEARAWFDWLSGQDFGRIIEVQDRAVGEIRLHSVSDRDRSAQLAVGLFEVRDLGLRIGRVAIRQTLDHAFGSMGLHRVGLRVLAFNTRAIRCYEACGFRHEGRLREAALIDGAWHDDILMGLLSHEHASLD